MVCTANICRSPMAEALLRHRVQGTLPEGKFWRIESAGVNAMEGIPPSRFSEAALSERGIDISGHRARTISEEMMNEFHLVLTMEKIHKQILRARFPEKSGKVFMLSEMSGEEFPVDDPFGATLEVYLRMAEVIDRLIENGMDSIRRCAVQGYIFGNMP
jgi:protein-tyrosine-phosphatase